MKNRIRVLHLGNPTGLYGAEHWILTLIKYLDSNVIESIVGAVKDAPGLTAPLCREAQALGHPAIVFEKHGRINPSAVKILRDYISSNRIDILHTHGYKTDIIGLLATLFTSCQIITTPHGWTHQPDTRLRAYELLDRMLFPFLDIVAPLSETMSQDLMKIPGVKKNIRLIKNGVDISMIDSVNEVDAQVAELREEGAFVIGYVGRLEPGKGIETLLRAVTGLNGINWRLSIVGEGKSRKDLEQFCRYLGIEKKVCFSGFQKDRISFLKGYDLFVLPSFSEGTPRCLMEAMAAGIPSIASDIPGCRTLIEDGKNGMLFQKGDVKELLDKIVFALSNERILKMYLKKARRDIELKFSGKRMAMEYEKVYLTIKNLER